MSLDAKKVDLLGIVEQAPAEHESFQEQPSDAEKDLVSACMEKYEEAKKSREGRKRLQEYYLQMLKGETLLARTKNSAEVLRVVVDSDARRPKSLDNLLRAMHRAFVGKLIKTIPSVRVQPRTADRSDALAAEVMESWCDFGWQAEKFKLKFKRGVECIDWAGLGLWQVYWDVFGGQRMATCPKCKASSTDQEPGEPCDACSAQMTEQFEGMPQGMEMPQMKQLDEQLRGQLINLVPKTQRAFEGALKMRTLHPFDFYPDPGAGDITECQYIIIARPVPVNVLRRDHPDKAHLIKASEGLYSERYVTMASGIATSRIETVWLKDHALKIELYEAGTGEYPDGRIITLCGDRILEEKKENIYWKLLGRPAAVYLARGDTDLGELWGEEIISQAEALQRERDILGTQMRQHRQLGGNPHWLTTWNSGIDMKQMPTTPGIIHKIRPGGQLRPLNLPPMPNWMPGEMDRLKGAVQEKYGVTPHELGQGQSGDSGRFAAFLDTQASGIVGAMLVEIHQEWLELHRAWIVLGQKLMPEERVWTITGKDRILTYAWGKANVQPGWDVYLAEEDSLSKNPVMRLQQAKDFHALGRYTDPRSGQVDWKAFDRDAGLHQNRVGPDTETSERTYAAEIPERMRAAMQQGAPPPYHQFLPEDDVFVILDELLGWLRTQGRTEKDPNLVAAVRQVWQAYAQSVMPDDPNQGIDPFLVKFLPNMKLAGMGQPPPPGPGPGRQPGEPGGGSGPPPQTEGGVPTSKPSGPQETAGKVQQADKRAEGAARTTLKHE